MRHIFWIAIIPFVVSGVLALVKKSVKGVNGKVYLTPFIAILGIFVAVLFFIPTVLTAVLGAPIGFPIAFCVLAFGGGALILAFVNCRISYDENGFCSKNFFGVKRKFTYDQVTSIQENVHESYLYMGKKRVLIDEYAAGGAEFIEFVKAKYLALHEDQPLPKTQKLKKDVFNGNLDSPTPKFVVIIVVPAVFITMCIGAICLLLFVPETMKEQQVTFKSWAFVENDMLLVSSGDQLFQVENVDEAFNAEVIKAVCDGETVVTVHTTYRDPDDKAHYYAIKTMEKDGELLLTLAETQRMRRQSQRPGVFFFAGFALFLLVWAVMMILIGRNAHKLDKRFVKLFFRENEILRSKSDTVQSGRAEK